MGLKSKKPPNYPYDEVMANAKRVCDDGATILQKWTCKKCKARCTANTPNHWTPLCVCEHCGTITDVRKTGCNFAAILAIGVPRP